MGVAEEQNEWRKLKKKGAAPLDPEEALGLSPSLGASEPLNLRSAGPHRRHFVVTALYMDRCETSSALAQLAFRVLRE